MVIQTSISPFFRPQERKGTAMTVNRQTLEGNWNEIKGKLHEKWGQVTDDELQTARGNVEQLIGLIQRRTGETRDSVTKFLEELTTDAGGTITKAREAVLDYAHQASESVQQTAQHAAESVRSGYHQTEELVRRRPVESLAVCFGAGLITGIVLGISMRSR
jgi:uncharacterized protein YjbJ (UPF0337 family)